MALSLIQLSNRGLLHIRGNDTFPFLQGLISQDVYHVTSTHSAWGAMLTPQGKCLHALMIFKSEDGLILEADLDRLADLMLRLKLYRLQSKVELTIDESMQPFALLPDVMDDGILDVKEGLTHHHPWGIHCVDPRWRGMGWRLWVDKHAAQDLVHGILATSLPLYRQGFLDEYTQYRMEHGIPETANDLPPERAILLENGFDELHGVDWDKGCYLGQELTARTRYRGLIRKRLFPLQFEGVPPQPGAAITLDHNNIGHDDIGVVRSVCGNRGLGMIRLEHLARATEPESPVYAENARVTLYVPTWMRLPQ